MHFNTQVADTLSSISHYSSPVYPYMDSVASKMSLFLESSQYASLKTRVPEIVTSVQDKVG